LTVVVDHASGRLVWAAPGAGQQDAGHVLRPARAPALHTGPAGVRGCGGADHRRGHRTLTATRRCAWTRSTSSNGPPTRSTRPALKCANDARRAGGESAGQTAERRPLGVVAQPSRTSPSLSRRSWTADRSRSVLAAQDDHRHGA
jgi:hypothetical protein